MTAGDTGVRGSAAVFALLETENGRARAVSAGPTIRETDVTVSGGSVVHALDALRVRSLLIPLADGQHGIDDESSAGVVLHPRTLLDGDRLLSYQSVSCDDPRLHPTFNSLCDEMVEALDRPGTAVDPGPVCVEVLDRWRDLLAPRRTGLLGEPALAGVLAELHLLEVLTAAHGAPTALGSWTANDRGRHDFRQGAHAVEVKATTSHVRFRVAIHGLTQLQPPDGGELYLYAEQLERAPGAGDSVPDTVDRLTAAGLSRRDILHRVSDRGYAASDETTYRTVRFDRLDTRHIRVSDGFPALTPTSLVDPTLAERVTDVTYSVDLTDTAALGALVTDEATVVAALGPA